MATMGGFDAFLCYFDSYDSAGNIIFHKVKINRD